jgi:hypothetical protein
LLNYRTPSTVRVVKRGSGMSTTMYLPSGMVTLASSRGSTYSRDPIVK